MSTFQEIAPIVSGAGITQEGVENYFANIPVKPELQPEPEITKAKITAVADKYFSGKKLSEFGGIIQVASDAGLSPSQVKNIIQEFNKLYTVWENKD